MIFSLIITSMVFYSTFLLESFGIQSPILFWIASREIRSTGKRSHSSWTGQTNHLKQTTWEDFLASVSLSLYIDSRRGREPAIFIVIRQHASQPSIFEFNERSFLPSTNENRMIGAPPAYLMHQKGYLTSLMILLMGQYQKRYEIRAPESL